MLNKKSDDRKTIFVDLDGTLVRHNLDPENIPDELLPGYEKLFDKNKYFVVLTTARVWKHCIEIVTWLKNRGYIFDAIICNLPTGHRILVNDFRNYDEDRAFGFTIPRNKGIVNVMEEIEKC